MNTTETQTVHGATQWLSFEKITSGSLVESIGAIGTIVLSIIGLAGVYPLIMASIAAIVIGAMLLAVGETNGSLAGQSVSPASGEQPVASIHRGVTAEFFGGLAGIVLGILALFQTAPGTLLACAVLVFGAALLLTGTQEARRVETTPEASGHVLIGLAAVVLGILAVMELVQMTLILVGLLSMGAAAMFRGSPLYGRLTSFTHAHGQ